MNERSERIVAGLSGIAFVVLSAVVAALPPFPAVGASAQAVVAYYGARTSARSWCSISSAWPGSFPDWWCSRI